jgi:hypothetical protein
MITQYRPLVKFQLEDSAITLDLDWRAPSFRSLLLRNLPSSLPGCSFKNLGKAKLIGRQTQFLANSVRNAITTKKILNEKSRSCQLLLTVR